MQALTLLLQQLVLSRIGPYIDAEHNFGGLPYWIRNVPNMFPRTGSPAWTNLTGSWIRRVIEHVRPYLATYGKSPLSNCVSLGKNNLTGYF